MKGWVFYAALPAVCWALFAHQPVAWAGSGDVIVAPCPPSGLPKTGQTKCYDAAGGEISCAGSGQDAEYADPAGSYDYGSPRGTGTWANYNATRFINNTDGTVTDRATGLMWVANSTAAGRGGSYLWYNAINASENLTYATYSDWRLPNVNELESIVNYHRNGPAIDTTFFVSRSAEYWSSTIFSYSWPGSIYVEFTWGTMQDFSREDDYAYIRPVRQSQ